MAGSAAIAPLLVHTLNVAVSKFPAVGTPLSPVVKLDVYF